MNSYCVVAVKNGDNYITSVCYSDSPLDAWILLQRSFKEWKLACALAYAGDFTVTCAGSYSSYHTDWGYNWSQCCPVVLNDRDSLVKHAESIGAAETYVFEQGLWRTEQANQQSDQLIA